MARIAKIVETEAYLGPHDLAAHSCKGLTRAQSHVWAADMLTSISSTVFIIA